MKGEYYSVLGLNPDASLEDVKKAFRKMALKYHPEKNPDHESEATDIFNQVAEAYEVLSDSKLRGIYDQYGAEGLRDGGTVESGIPGGYRLNVDAETIFRRFFGIENPFQQIGDLSPMQGTEHQFFSKEGARNKNPPQCPQIEVSCVCSLEDIYDGAFKTVHFDYQVVTEDGTSSTEQKKLDLQIEKGCPKGTKILFSKAGNQRAGWITGDVAVVVEQAPHLRFERHGADLHCVFDITLEQALTGFPIEVDTLDG
eukprot:EG_transcript_25414